MITWIFGKSNNLSIYDCSARSISGGLELERADVDWSLSLESSDIPNGFNGSFRSIQVDGEELEFSKGFTELHVDSYRKILSGEGFGINDSRESIRIVSDIRKMTNLTIIK